jgi:hypothetical protein
MTLSLSITMASAQYAYPPQLQRRLRDNASPFFQAYIIGGIPDTKYRVFPDSKIRVYTDLQRQQLC